MSSSRPAAFSRGPTANPRSLLTVRCTSLPRLLEQGANAGDGFTGPDPAYALLDENPVVVIERHHVGDSAEGNQIEVLRRNSRCARRSFFFQRAAQRGYDIESHSDARKIAARKSTARQVGVNDNRCIRNFLARQVVIRHEHGNSPLPWRPQHRQYSKFRCRL